MIQCFENAWIPFWISLLMLIVVNQHLRCQISQKPGWIGLGTYRWRCDQIDVFRLGHSPDCRRFDFTVHVLSFWSVLTYDIRRIWRCYIDHIKRSVHLYVRRDAARLVDKMNNSTSKNSYGFNYSYYISDFCILNSSILKKPSWF